MKRTQGLGIFLCADGTAVLSRRKMALGIGVSTTGDTSDSSKEALQKLPPIDALTLALALQADKEKDK